MKTAISSVNPTAYPSANPNVSPSANAACVQLEVGEQASRVMDKLFSALCVYCPAWKQSLPDDEAVAEFKTLWLEELINHNVRNWRLVARGLAQCKQRKDRFLPTVGEFIEWCLSEDYAALGLPDEAELLRRLRVFQGCGMENLHEFKFRSDAEYWLITDLYARGKAGEWRDKELAKEASSALIKMAKRIKQGEKIPPMAVSLPEKVAYVDPAKTLQWIKTIKANLGVGR